MTKTDLTSLFISFRESYRHLWNTNLDGPDENPEIQDWEAFLGLEERLFDALVLSHVGKKLKNSDVRVVPREGARLLYAVDRQSRTRNFVEVPAELSTLLHLRYCGLFDWTATEVCEFPFIETEVVASQADQICTGAAVLVPALQANVFWVGILDGSHSVID